MEFCNTHNRGYKAAISRQLILALDLGVRYSFSDDLDGSNSNNEDADPIYQFGNPNSNDWYTFTGFTLTYTFGRKPCYCNFLMEQLLSNIDKKRLPKHIAIIMDGNGREGLNRKVLSGQLDTKMALKL